MSDRDRLAADLSAMEHDYPYELAMMSPADIADRLIALGWTRAETCDPPCGDCCTEHPHWTHRHSSDALDEERLARALGPHPQDPELRAKRAAVIAKAYREDEG